MKISFRKFNQLGFLSFHAILPVAAAVLVIGGVGSYVLQSSKAFSGTGPGGAVGSTPKLSCTQTTPSSVTRGNSFNVKVTCKNTGGSTGYAYANGRLLKGTTNYYASGSEVGDIKPGQTVSKSIVFQTSKFSTGATLPLGNYTVSVKYNNTSGTTTAPATTGTLTLK